MHHQEGPAQGLSRKSPQIDSQGPPNPALIPKIQETKTGSYQNVKTLADMGLMRLSWIYDCELPSRVRRIRERRLLEDGVCHPPDTAEVRAIISSASEFHRAEDVL